MQSDSVGVERRRLPFTLVENIVLEDQELGPVDILVYIALAKHADSEGTCWPSLATIARLARVCRSSVAQAIKRLEARGYLQRTARFRPDGGVTSNVYKLMPMEVKAYPVAQADTPRPAGAPAPVQQVDTNYIHLEPKPIKEREERAPARGIRSLPDHEASPEPSSLSSFLAHLKQEAKARTCPIVISKDWREGIGELVRSGIPEEELLQAFEACIETAPDRVTFFPRDFLKWRKVWRDRAVKVRKSIKTRRTVRHGRGSSPWSESGSCVSGRIPGRRQRSSLR